MPDTPDLFSSQAQERPDASSPTGRKVVYEDDPEPKGETLPDGRFDGEGEWSYEAVTSIPWEEHTHKQRAMWMLYKNRRLTERMFYDQTRSFKLRARIADLRQIDDAPPIVTDEDTDPTTYYIPKADTDYADT